MNTQLKKLAALSVAISAVAISFSASPLYAQRDGGAKARGDMSPFWSPKYRSRSSSRGFVYRQPASETRRSFSYEPADAVTGSGCGSRVQPAPAEPTAAQPQVERRSFSYEPTYSYQPSYRTNRRYSAPKKAPWQYPKSDPRRYRP
jgi:hypothetical protein